MSEGAERVGRERMLEALSVAIDRAGAAGADDVEVSAVDAERTSARFASSDFGQVTRVRQATVRVRVLHGGRLGAATCTSFDHAQLRTAAETAAAIAARAPKLGVRLAFSGPGADDCGDPRDVISGEAPTPLATALATATATAAASAGSSAASVLGRIGPPSTPAVDETGGPDRETSGLPLERLREAFDAHRAVELFGAFKATDRQFAVMTQRGLGRVGARASSGLEVIAHVGEQQSGWASAFAPSRTELNAMDVVARAAAIAERNRDPQPLASGRYDVVLSSAATATLLEWLAVGSFSARSVLDGTSVLSVGRGVSIASPAITIREEPPNLACTFDSEGTTRRPVDFIRHGVAGEPVTDLVSAARLGHGPSTGHAAPLSATAMTTDATCAHVILDPGTDTEEQLIAKVDRGLYVTRLHYVNGLLDTKSATMTGMTRDGTFLIQGGKLGPAVKNLRMTDSILSALGKGHLGGIGSQLLHHPTTITEGGLLTAPALLLTAVHFHTS